jgi:hypothetical protein
MLYILVTASTSISYLKTWLIVDLKVSSLPMPSVALPSPETPFSKPPHPTTMVMQKGPQRAFNLNQAPSALIGQIDLPDRPGGGICSVISTMYGREIRWHLVCKLVSRAPSAQHGRSHTATQQRIPWLQHFGAIDGTLIWIDEEVRID